MLNGLRLDIEGFGLINDAHIEIGKINVVGGVNASGKSTASKLLYCFLKAMSLNRKDYLLAAVLPKVNEFVNYMEISSLLRMILKKSAELIFTQEIFIPKSEMIFLRFPMKF